MRFQMRLPLEKDFSFAKKEEDEGGKEEETIAPGKQLALVLVSTNYDN